MIALACSQPLEGFARWTIRLLAEHVVERNIVPAAHFDTVGRALKKALFGNCVGHPRSAAAFSVGVTAVRRVAASSLDLRAGAGERDWLDLQH